MATTFCTLPRGVQQGVAVSVQASGTHSTFRQGLPPPSPLPSNSKVFNCATLPHDGGATSGQARKEQFSLFRQHWQSQTPGFPALSVFMRADSSDSRCRSCPVPPTVHVETPSDAPGLPTEYPGPKAGLNGQETPAPEALVRGAPEGLAPEGRDSGMSSSCPEALQQLKLLYASWEAVTPSCARLSKTEVLVDTRGGTHSDSKSPCGFVSRVGCLKEWVMPFQSGWVKLDLLWAGVRRTDQRTIGQGRGRGGVCLSLSELRKVS